MTRRRIGFSVVGALCFIAAALLLAPRAIDAQHLLANRDDPAALSERALDGVFDTALAEREMASALAAGDADLAGSFLDLARARGVALDPALAARVEAAVADAQSASAMAGNFARGLVTGEPDDIASFAGTTLGDLFVFGDVRDVVREGARLARGEEADELVLGLAGVGLAITAGTYASFGAAAPARVGVSVVKAARKTGRLGVQTGEWLGRALRDAVDVSALRRALGGASVTEPAVAVRAARGAVKVERAEGLMSFVRDVGRVQSKAGTHAALDGLKLAQGPREVARVAKLAEKQGSKTRAILKVLGRGAIALTFGLFDLAMWIFWAVLMVFGFVSSSKAAVERMTQRHLHRRKAKRALAAIRARQDELAQAPACMPPRDVMPGWAQPSVLAREARLTPRLVRF